MITTRPMAFTHCFKLEVFLHQYDLRPELYAAEVITHASKFDRRHSDVRDVHLLAIM